MTSVRNKILDEAKEIINNDRQNTYGKPEDNFGIIAEYWTTWLKSRGIKCTITPFDVGAMMDLMKTAREASSPEHMDNLRDKLGYIALTAELVSRGLHKSAVDIESIEEKKSKFPPLKPDIDVDMYERFRNIAIEGSPLVGTMPTIPEDLTTSAIRNAEVSTTKQTFEEKGLEYAK